MYTATFYSFKGGVGRTLALVNIGAELARRGKRVLLVDFDLEAPGLHTFDLLRPTHPVPGVVDFVSSYLSTLESPDVREYCYQVQLNEESKGELWIMPAGAGDDSYSNKLAAIDWGALYAEHDGYLMVEDLRAQWRDQIAPDYVLVDSRTGHTDVAGICTRQLPDAVVVLFFPNRQNLEGLRTTVADIRLEEKSPRRHQIDLHFVMSNVPDLDDEDQILESRVLEFKEALGYEELAGTIHHYDSLALLNQVIFTLDRPKSRLAREYVSLKEAIVSHNLEDREAAIHQLQQTLAAPSWLRFAGKEASDAHLKEIHRLHSQDGKVLFLLAMVHKRAGRAEESLRLLEKASGDTGYPRSRILIERAEVRQLCGDLAGATKDVFEALSFEDLSADEVQRTIRLLRKTDVKSLKVISATPAVRHLTPQDKAEVAGELKASREELAVSAELLTSVLPHLDSDGKEYAQNELMMALIGLGRFKEAMVVGQSIGQALDALDVAMSFNYAMAEWAETRRIQQHLFERVVKLDSEDSDSQGANYHQCIAIALWATGKSATALIRLQEAQEIMSELPEPEFSCWRYLKVSPQEFLKDCEEVAGLIRGHVKMPAFCDAPLFDDQIRHSAARGAK